MAQRAEDLERATAFYTDLFGHGPAATYDPPGLVFFRLGSTRLLLDRMAPSSLIYLAVDDLERTVAEARARGVVIDTEPYPIFEHADDTLGPAGSEEWHAFIRDSEDNLVGLVEIR